MKRRMAMLAAIMMAVTTVASAQESTEAPAAPESITTTGADIDAASGAMSTPDSRSMGYDLRMTEMEEQLDELREDTFRSRSRLFLLREQILEDTLGGAQAVIRHHNDFGRAFRIVSVIYSLDGTQIYAANAEGSEIEDTESLEILRRSLLPGAHNLSVRMVVEGRQRGIFAYPKGYRFTVTSSHAFTVESGQTVDLDVYGYRQGGGSTDYTQRPSVRFAEHRQLTRELVEEPADQQATE